MKHPDLTALSHKLDPEAGTCRAVVETPKGRRSKFDYDPKTGLFKLKQLLPDGMSFPVDFGFVPSTLCEDGDPLDIMLLYDEPVPVGTVLEVRLIGGIEGEQTGQDGKTIRNDRVMGVPVVSHLYAKIRRMSDLEKAFTDNLCKFWVNKDALEGKTFKVLGTREPDWAIEQIQDAARTAKAA
jgi:inorganic pyrophosphatase